MVTTNQIVNGIMAYANAELLPKLDGVRRYGTAVYLALAGGKAGDVLHEYMRSPAIRMLALEDDAGHIDLDRLHHALIQSMQTDKLMIDLPLLGAFTFNRQDIDNLCNMIRQSAP